jgi:NAD(P)-dependent dehydrogenase (short-subunit alcohol dehydrogenase family)
MGLSRGAAGIGGCLLLAAVYRRYCQRIGAPLQSGYTTATRVMQHYSPDLRNKVYIVTGAGRGLGLETAHVLLFQGNAHVILAVRDLAVGSSVARAWTAAYAVSNAGLGGTVRCVHLDLTSLQSVRDFAVAFLARHTPLDGLVNNGGVFQLQGATRDGFQNVWQTNYLSHCLLTDLLLPAATPTFRMVNVSSKLHRLVGSSPLVDRIPPPAGGGSSYSDYAFSKACQVAHAIALEHTFALQDLGVGSTVCRRMAFAVEPGLVQTGIMRQSSGLVRWLNYLLMAPLLKTVEQGVSCTLYCLVASDLHAGGFFEDCARVKAARACLDEEAVRMVHLASLKIAGVYRE